MQLGKLSQPSLLAFAFTLVSWPNIILTPAFVAGLTLVLMRQRPGMVKTPAFLTSFAATVTRLFRMLEQSFVFMSCLVAIAFNKAPFVITFEPPDFIAFGAFIAFIDFMGAMLETKEEFLRKSQPRI